VEPALEAAGILEQQGICLSVVNMRFIKPIDRVLVEDILRRFPAVMTLENNTVIGGLGSAVAEIAAEQPETGVRFQRMGLPDRFVTHGCLPKILEETGLDIPRLVKTMGSFEEMIR
jgi:1-deoxy-D-xylulose-5-phosphate synthase